MHLSTENCCKQNAYEWNDEWQKEDSENSLKLYFQTLAVTIMYTAVSMILVSEMFEMCWRKRKRLRYAEVRKKVKYVRNVPDIFQMSWSTRNLERRLKNKSEHVTKSRWQ